jgi:regulator of replication initiation timing
MAHEDDRERLKAALEECARLKVENLRLKSLLGVPEEKPRDTVVEGIAKRARLLCFAVSSEDEKMSTP